MEQVTTEADLRVRYKPVGYARSLAAFPALRDHGLCRG